MEIIERQKRLMDVFSDPSKKSHVLSKFLLKKEMTLKDSVSRERAIIERVTPEGDKILITVSDSEKFRMGSEVILYKILARYIQVECKVIQDKGNNQFVMEVKRVGIAQKDREFKRMQLPPGYVWITNILTNKASIETNMMNIPTSVKVNFSNFESKLKNNHDFAKIDVFRSDLHEKFQVIKKTGKALLIENTLSKDSYNNPPSDDFIHYEDEIDQDLDDAIKYYKDHGITSELIVPITYISLDETATVIGFIQVQSKNEYFDMMKAIELKTLGFEMVDRIRNSNTLTVTEKFIVLDMSRGGMKVKIDHPDLIASLPKQAGFTFDLFFKMQSPMTAFGLIRSINKDIDGNLILGIAITGHSSRKGEKKRFLENFELLQQKLGSFQDYLDDKK